MALSSGILTGSIIFVNPFVLFGCLILFAGLLLWINSCYSYALTTYFGVVVNLFFIGTGILLYQNYNQKPEFFNNGKFIASVQEIMQEKQNSYQSVLKIHGFIEKDSIIPTEEMVMVYFEKNDAIKEIKPGQMLFFNQTPKPIRNNNNPYEFDYKNYLSKKKIYRQVYLSSGSWYPSDQLSIFSLSVLAEKVRLKLLNIFAQQKWVDREIDVISALTLGYKRGLDPDTKSVFTSAGAMHVLAVSGLHVGILFLILSCVFGFLNQPGVGKIVFIILILFFLWGFAFVTGLSPSVKRAATMFTFVVIGRSLKRQVNIYNTLAASAFFLLLFNPNNLFDAGFQLSYLAVFGIVFFQPRFTKLIYFRYKLARYFWRLFTVSVAAQLSIFPVAVFYFQQFPVYFWISSMIVLPAVTILIPLGIVLLAFSWTSYFAGFISGITGYILKLLINFLEWIEQLPHSVVNLHFSGMELTFISAVLLSFFFFVQFPKVKYLKGILFFFLLYLTTSLGIHAICLFRSEIIVYNYPGQYVLHLISGKKNYIVSEEEIKKTDHVHNVIANTVKGLRINPPVYLTCSQYYSDAILYCNKGLISFDGKIVHFHTRSRQIDSPFIPDIVVGTMEAENKENKLFQAEIILRDTFTNNDHSLNVYNLSKKGAYRKKW